jgi:hypothetical protein
MSRLGAVIAAAIGSFTLACGGGNSESTEPLDSPEQLETEQDGAEPGTGETPEPQSELPGDQEWGLAFSLVGRDVPMRARAEIKIIEGEDAVHVSIVGRTSGTDMMMIDLTFDGLENALGPHREEFSLPEGGAHMANGSLDDNWYYSQGGTIEVDVSREGAIQGTFNIALALGQLGAPDEPIVFETSEEVVPLDGEFSGSWVLNCHSRLPGHQSTIPGGEYCENLDL